MPITALLPTTVSLPEQAPEGVVYLPYDPRQLVPEEHLDAEVLVGWHTTDTVLADAAQRMPKLRLVQMLSAGTDNAIRADFRPETIIASGRGLHDLTVTEHTLALILAAARRLHRAFAAQHRAHWDTEIGGLQQEPSPGLFSTLRGARVLIWGYGSIGSTLAPHLIALGATVTGVGRRARQEGAVRVIDETEILDELRRTDVVVMILPSTPETRHIMDAATLAALPPHAWVINVGRGDAVDADALITALEAGSIGGAALDVTDPEPLPESALLWRAPNLILTPHAAGGRPLGAHELLAHNLAALVDGTPLRNVVAR